MLDVLLHPQVRGHAAGGIKQDGQGEDGEDNQRGTRAKNQIDKFPEDWQGSTDFDLLKDSMKKQGEDLSTADGTSAPISYISRTDA